MREDRASILGRLHRAWKRAGEPSQRALARRLLVNHGIEVSNTTVSNYLTGSDVVPEPDRMNIELISGLCAEFGISVASISDVIVRRATEELPHQEQRVLIFQYAAWDSNPEPTDFGSNQLQWAIAA
jgi:transcriptional regulator with XRE-family HTH domain